jgi:hypothetical protein
MEPIYYPLEMPLAGMPIELPRIEFGGSMLLVCSQNMARHKVFDRPQ